MKPSRLSRRPRIACSIEFLESRQMLSVVKITPVTKVHVMAPIFRAVQYQKDGVTPLSTTSPTGLSPSVIRSAYGVNNILFGNITGNGAGQTIAIIDAYDDPKMISSSNTNTSSGYSTSDLYKFNDYYGLQQFGTSGGPTFTKINQTGGTTYPTADAGWAGEISLDVEWAHVMAPMANIVLIEASSAYDQDIIVAATAEARSLTGVTAVSMSFGGGEDSSELSEDSSFSTQPSGRNITYFASAGDDGAAAEYPAASPYVVAVGGTSLYTSGSSYSSESAWSGSGGGISSYESKPSYQSGVTQSSTKRTVPDISIDANPNTGVPVYNTYGTSAPWTQVGGTSLSAPLWAGLDAIINQGLAANGRSTFTSQQLLTKLYQTPSSYFHDVTSGSNGNSATAGYDLVTGLGTPIANTLVPYVAGYWIAAPTLAASSDSGISSSDRITNVTKPTFTGTTGLTGNVNILVDNVVYGTATVVNGGYTVMLSSALTDGVHSITAAIASLMSSGISMTEDTTAPTITSKSFNYLTKANSVAVVFSEDVSATTSASDFTVTNTTDGNTTAPSVSYASGSNTATLTFPGYANGTLAKGVYTATAAASSITDVAGNALAAPLNYSFFFLPGDANHDGKVDVVDLGILSGKWQSSGTYADGDFDYSGTVDVVDLGILSSNWQATLAIPAVTPESAVAAATKVATIKPVTKVTAAIKSVSSTPTIAASVFATTAVSDPSAAALFA